jgi:hypothetical protein
MRHPQILSLLLVFTLTITSLMIIESACAQSIPKPPAPEFNLKYVDYSYDVPPVYGTNPYNGNTEIIESGRHVYQEYVEVWIKNPSFQKYTDASNNKIVLGYDVQWKGHYGNEWANMTYAGYLLSSGSEYTVVSYWLSELISTGDQLDFRVATFIGYYNSIFVPRLPVFGSEARTILVFTGQTSDFSNEQTILINNTSALNNKTSPAVSPDPGYAPIDPFNSGDNSPIPTPTPEPTATAAPTPTRTPTITPSPTQTNSFPTNQSVLIGIGIVAVAAVAVAAVLLIYFKKHKIVK